MRASYFAMCIVPTARQCFFCNHPPQVSGGRHICSTVAFRAVDGSTALCARMEYPTWLCLYMAICSSISSIWKVGTLHDPTMMLGSTC